MNLYLEHNNQEIVQEKEKGNERESKKIKTVSEVFASLLLPFQLFYAFIHQHFLQVQHI